MNDAPRPIWKTCLLVGCGLALLFGIAGGVLVVMNWDTLSKSYDEAKSALGSLLEVQTAVREHTGASDVRVHVSSTSGVEGKTLKIELVNSSFLPADPGDPGAREKALGIAVVARDALAESMEFARYEIVHTDRVQVGVTVTSSQRHVFAASELPPRTAPPASEPR